MGGKACVISERSAIDGVKNLSNRISDFSFAETPSFLFSPIKGGIIGGSLEAPLPHLARR